MSVGRCNTLATGLDSGRKQVGATALTRSKSAFLGQDEHPSPEYGDRWSSLSRAHATPPSSSMPSARLAQYPHGDLHHTTEIKLGDMLCPACCKVPRGAPT